MLTLQEITSAKTRLVADKLTSSDVDSIVSSWRLLLGPLEDKYQMNLRTDLSAIDDSVELRDRAAKLAACLIRLENEDFGVSVLGGDLVNDDAEQRRLFIVYMLSIVYKVPAELAYLDIFTRNSLLRKNTITVPITFVP